LNQKHAWPFTPVTFRLSKPCAEADGEAHQNINGISCGTLPFHGARLPSIAWRGGGNETAPWPNALERNELGTSM
jgi:hypothetical protein